jgi:hypothetical protein
MVALKTVLVRAEAHWSKPAHLGPDKPFPDSAYGDGERPDDCRQRIIPAEIWEDLRLRDAAHPLIKTEQTHFIELTVRQKIPHWVP